MLKIIITWLILSGTISAIAVYFNYIPWKPVLKFLIASGVSCMILAMFVVAF